MMYKTVGVLQYDPPRPGLKKKASRWVVLNLDRDITRYYRYWIERNPVYFNDTNIQVFQPSWDAHVSVVRGEADLRNGNQDAINRLWKKYDGKRFEISYSGMVRKTKEEEGNQGDYFFVDIDAPGLLDIRRELGLRTNWNLHLTVGRTWER